MADGTAFLGLFQYFKKFGPVYKLCFGPKSFIVVSDPTIVKFILKTNSAAYDKVTHRFRLASSISFSTRFPD